VFGRDGTAEATAPIPVAKFSYGTAITGGQLNYGFTVSRGSGSALGIALGSMQQRPPVVGTDHGVGT